MSDLLTLVPQLGDDPGPWALVTLIQAEGSTYRKAGAHLLVSQTRRLGMLSGGCLEADVAARCAPVLRGEEQVLEFVIDTRRLLGCEGRLTLLAERLPDTLAPAVQRVLRERTPLTLFTRHSGPNWSATSTEGDQRRDFAHRVLPQLRLCVFGSGPGAQPLKSMAEVLGWTAEQLVLASDPASRYPSDAWTVLGSAALAREHADSRTACVLMNHHVGRDSELLLALWGSATPFLGLLGSRRRRDQILGRLSFEHDLDLGHRELFAPVGLDLAAEGASQIALEICAQVQRVLAGESSANAVRELPSSRENGVHPRFHERSA